MTHAANPVLMDHEHLSLLDKLAVWTGWGVALAIFYTLGWMAMAPTDPLGPVSLLARGLPWAMLMQSAGLAAVTAAFATVLSGRQLPHAGPFAAALGLAAVSLRGETSESLLLAAAGGAEPPARVLAGRLAVESLGWLGVILLTMVVSALVARWCFGRSIVSEQEETQDVTPSSRVFDGPLFMAVATIASLLVFCTISNGLQRRAIQHGQVCFMVGASIWLGCLFAQRIIAARSVIWSVFAVALLAIIGYLWAGGRSVDPNLPPGVPTSPFSRVLPIQFIAVGTAAAISSWWSMLRYHAAHAGGDPSESATRAEGRR